MKHSPAVPLLAVLVIFTVAVPFFPGCGDDKEAKIVIHDGQFAEMRLIHQAVKALVEEHTTVKVEIRDEMSPVNSFNTLIKGDCDLMNSYDGTVLATFLRIDPADVPEGTTLYDFVNKTALEKHQVRLLAKLGLNNTYAIAMPRPLAERYNLSTVSELVPVAGELVFGAEHEFFSQEGSMRFRPFNAFYGLKFKDTKAIDIGLKYFAIESGNIDVTVAYATDGLNKKANLMILTDDRRFFPEYNGALLVRDDLFTRLKDKAPDLENLLNRLGGLFTDEIMTDLSYAVDVEEKAPAEVARAFLREKGLIK